MYVGGNLTNEKAKNKCSNTVKAEYKRMTYNLRGDQSKNTSRKEKEEKMVRD